MKRLLRPLLASLALPTAVNAEEFAELKPINPHSYMKSSLRRWEKERKKYITFKGSSIVLDCYGDKRHLVHVLPLLVIIPIISMPKEKQLKLLTNMVGKHYYLNIQSIAMKKHTIEKVTLWV